MAARVLAADLYPVWGLPDILIYDRLKPIISSSRARIKPWETVRQDSSFCELRIMIIRFYCRSAHYPLDSSKKKRPIFSLQGINHSTPPISNSFGDKLENLNTRRVVRVEPNEYKGRSGPGDATKNG